MAVGEIDESLSTAGLGGHASAVVYPEQDELDARHELFDVAGTNSVHSGETAVRVRGRPGHPVAGFNSASCCR
jgi:hypothetical protein